MKRGSDGPRRRGNNFKLTLSQIWASISAVMTVGQLAERSGVPATTLRYYDSIGLLVPLRAAGGHRRYDATALEVLELLALCRAAGLSLDEARLVVGGDAEQRRDVAAARLTDVDRRIQELTAVREVLAHFAVCRHRSDAGRRACRETVTASLGRLQAAAG
jgi:DNA-binding transcriptional MerR regulator